MTTPTNGATLTSNSETFTWNANGNAVTEWWFRLGSTVGGKNIYESGNIGATNSVLVNSLPTDGSTIYGRLSIVTVVAMLGKAKTLPSLPLMLRHQ